MVYRACLENKYAARHRGFDSHPLRQNPTTPYEVWSACSNISFLSPPYPSARPRWLIRLHKDIPTSRIRAIWVDAGAIPKSEDGIANLVRLYKKANINVLLPEVIARGYTAYPSKLLARDPRFAGAIDPMPILIREAHAAGMEVHPWVWVFRAGYTQDRGAILKAHPDWVELSKYGEDLSANGGFWISPSIPEARDFLIDLFKELVGKYDVDGIHLDYIRYEVQSPSPYGYCQYARDAFKKSCGIDPMDVDRLTSDQYSWDLYRERQINTFVQRVSTELRAIKPRLVISAAVGPNIKDARLNLLQNWANWVDNKWVDFLTPDDLHEYGRVISPLWWPDRSRQCAIK